MATSAPVTNWPEARPTGVSGSWVVLVMCFLSQFISGGLWSIAGIINAFLLEAFQDSMRLTAIPTAMMAALLNLGSLPASLVDNRFGQKKTLILGTVMAAVGLVLSAFSPSIVWLIPSLGLLCGLGLALCYIPTLTILPRYFDRYLTAAFAVSSTGSCLGLLVLSQFVAWAVDEYSWRGMLILMAGILLQQCPMAFFLKVPQPPDSQNRQAEETNNTLKDSTVAPEDYYKENIRLSWRINEPPDKLPLSPNDSLLDDGNSPDCEFVDESDKDEEQGKNFVDQGCQCNMLVSTKHLCHKNIESQEAVSGKSIEHLHHVPSSPVSNRLSLNEKVASLQRNGSLSRQISPQHGSVSPCKVHEKYRLPTATRKAGKVGLLHLRLSHMSSNNDLHQSDLSLNRSGTLSRADFYKSDVDSVHKPYRLTQADLRQNSLSSSIVAIHLAGSQSLGPAPEPPEEVVVQKCASFHPSIFCNKTYLLQIFSAFFRAASRSTVYMHITSYAIYRGFSLHKATLLMTLLGVAQLIMRPVTGLVATKLRTLNLQLWAGSATLAGGAIFLCVASSHRHAALYAFFTLYGFIEAVYDALWGPVFAQTLQPYELGSGLGVAGCVYGVAGLIAPPLTGWLVDATGNYDGPLYLAGICNLTAGTIAFLSLVVAKRSSGLKSIKRDHDVAGKPEVMPVYEEPLVGSVVGLPSLEEGRILKDTIT